jgi:hypothetical protein
MPFDNTGLAKAVYNEIKQDILSLIETNNTSASGVTTITVSGGLSSSPSIISSTGNITLNAGLCDLIDVNKTASLNQVLTWTGTSWQPATFSGSEIATFLNLSDTPVSYSGHENKNLMVNSIGTCVVFSNHTDLNSVVAGEGIHVTPLSNRSQIMRFNPPSITETATNNASDFFIIHTSGGTKKIKSSNVSNTHHNNTASYITYDSLTGGNGISFNNTTGSISFINSVIPANDFNTGGISGTLSILHGGTSANSILGAQTNLQVRPNVDVLAQSGPSFRSSMYGVNINLMPDTFDIALTYSGASYTSDSFTKTLINTNLPTDTFSVCVSLASGGSILDFTPSTLTGRMSNLHSDLQNIFYVSPSTGASALVSVTPEMCYLTFGPETNGPSSAIGIRNNYGTLQFKTSRTTIGASSWRNFYPFSIGELTDVNTGGGISRNDILIYTGTSFRPYTMTGHGTLTGEGVFSLDIPDEYITAPKIYANGLTLTGTDFEYLSGVSRNIQFQLDGKIGLSTTIPVMGDLVYYAGDGSSWQPLRTAGNYGKFLNVSESEIPNYAFLGDILGTCTDPVSVTQPYIPYAAPGVSTTRYSFMSFLDGAVNTGGGVSTALHIINERLAVDFTYQTRGTELVETDIVPYHKSGELYINTITIANLTTSLAGTNLTGENGKFSFNTAGSSLPYVNLKHYSYGISGQVSAGVSGRLAYFSDGNAGQPCLALSYNNKWNVISLGAEISL